MASGIEVETAREDPKVCGWQCGVDIWRTVIHIMEDAVGVCYDGVP